MSQKSVFEAVKQASKQRGHKALAIVLMAA